MGFSRPVGLEQHHHADDFECGIGSLDEWLRKYALQSHRSGGARVFVSTVGGHEIAGYYALAAGAVTPANATARVVTGLASNQPVPVVLLARLAVDRRWQRQGLGRSLLQDAMLRVLEAANLIGVRALLVHAADERARAWYSQLGFEPSPTHPLHLTLLIKDLRATARQFSG